MRKTRFEASAVIDARAEEIYGILADYRNEHPRIVPAEYLRGLEVEAGGYGAGTIIRYRTRAFGVERAARAVVTEPEPGRILVETTPDYVTTFTVTPVADGQQADVSIATEWQPARNLMGKLEQAMYPLVMKPMYNKELVLIAKYVKNKNSVAAGVASE
jgi:hypothetical protein